MILQKFYRGNCILTGINDVFLYQ